LRGEERKVQSSRKVCRKNRKNPGGSENSTGKSTGENEEVCE